MCTKIPPNNCAHYSGLFCRNRLLYLRFRVINTVPKGKTQKTEGKNMTELQNFIDGYGFGISVQKLAEKAYRHM